ncbi:unnamed protein product, partial [Hydatigera taeniaeformis]|uniref:Protein-tyrosine phosphatase n=1 Tax=Hydatigena taeniaeformis TaxID=6205 RepID=A0A0R3XB39_HYDTA
MPWLSEREGFSQSFDSFDVPLTTRWMKELHRAPRSSALQHHSIGMPIYTLLCTICHLFPTLCSSFRHMRCHLEARSRSNQGCLFYATASAMPSCMMKALHARKSLRHALPVRGEDYESRRGGTDVYCSWKRERDECAVSTSTEDVGSEANYLEEDVMDDQVADTGDAPPRPPKSITTESRNSIRNASPAGIWMESSSSTQRLDVSPNHHYHRCQSQQPQHQKQFQVGPPSLLSKPRINSYGTIRDKSSSAMGLRKALTSGTESLYLSIRDIESGLADGSLVRQFEKLERGDPHATTLDAQINVRKNRYRDISPYDHTRVKILGADGDYINASFIEMTIPKAALRKYIASQGPLKTTCADFWEMCWEHDSELIVMLTDVGEQGRDATAAGLSLKPSKPSITSFSREKGPPILNGAEVRRIVQLQYIQWPDHGVPSNCADLIAFVERMREIRDCGKSTYAVVHCSAGIGRTGVVILL